MREVAPGDVVFSFADTQIKSIGVIASHAYEAPKPLEFGQAGANWDVIGWRADVRFTELRYPIYPSAHMETLKPVLQKRYAPLLPDGRGLQSVYLTALPESFVAKLVDLIGAEGRDLVQSHRVAEEMPILPGIGLIEWEQHELDRLREDQKLTETERKQSCLRAEDEGYSRRG